MCEGSGSQSAKLREFSLSVFLSPHAFFVRLMDIWRNKSLRQPAVHRVEAGSVLRGVTFTLRGHDHFRCWILRFHLSFYINCLARWMLLKTLRTFLPSEISSSWKPQVLTFWSCIHWPHCCPVCCGITVWRVGLDQGSWSSSHRDGTKSSPW